MATTTNLPEDVVTDGEIVSVPLIKLNPAELISSKVSKVRPSIKTCNSSVLSSGVSNKQLDLDLKERCESGYGSLCSQSSLSSSGSPASSLGPKFEPIPERNPVQCSDSVDEEDIRSKLSQINIASKTDDEGIDSIISEESITSVEASTVETPNDYFSLEEAFSEEDGDGDTILHTAILSEMISLVFALIQLCPTLQCLNTQNKLFQTPLHLAALTNLSEIVRKLVSKGADVLMRDQQGNTALHIACRNGNKDIIETIVESVKNDKNRLHKLFTLKNSEGLTCLHIAAEKKQYIIMGYLFAKGADVNIGDAKSGRTVLHYAVEKRDMETVKVLLTHKDIDVDCVTFKGESPLVIAYWRNYQDIVKKLRSKGAYFSFDLVEDWEEEEATP